MKENEPKLIPKGAFRSPGEIPQVDEQQAVIVDDSPNAAKEAVVRAKKLALQVDTLQKTLAELSEKNNTLQSKANDYDGLKKELEQAREAIKEFGEGPVQTVDRRTRRFQLLNSLLTGFAATGQLYGKEVREEQVNNILKHAVGLALRAEDSALMRGF